MKTIMETNNIYKFINSKDISRYLEKTDYQLSAAEIAFLIWQCRKLTVKQRHHELYTLILMSDSCLIKNSCCREGWDLHQTIKEYNSLENKLIDLLMNNDDKCYYNAEYFDNNDWYDGDCFFDNWDDAYRYAKEYADNENLYSIRIMKHYIDNSSSHSAVIEAIYNFDGELMKIDKWETPIESWTENDDAIWDERFPYMWFDIPIPFKPGDIVCDCYDRIPFVITSTVPWYRKEHPPKNKSTLHLGEFDMTASGYSIDKNKLTVDYNWLSFPYMNLEYYTDELSGPYRILKAYSLFKQDKINGDTLTKLVQLYTNEALAERNYHSIDWVMDDDTVKYLDIEKFRRK